MYSQLCKTSSSSPSRVTQGEDGQGWQTSLPLVSKDAFSLALIGIDEHDERVHTEKHSACDWLWAPDIGIELETLHMTVSHYNS